MSAKGTAAQPVIIRSAPGAKVIFDGTPLGTWVDPIVFDDAAYVVLDGLEIRNSEGHGIAIKRSRASGSACAFFAVITNVANAAKVVTSTSTERAPQLHPHPPPPPP